jgi:hypothetical protein
VEAAFNGELSRLSERDHGGHGPPYAGRAAIIGRPAGAERRRDGRGPPYAAVALMACRIHCAPISRFRRNVLRFFHAIGVTTHRLSGRASGEGSRD